jgi:acyl-coenzyme A synthetase/AMP-(fatty) acid ligase
MSKHNPSTLAGLSSNFGDPRHRFIADAVTYVRLDTVLGNLPEGERLAAFQGRSVLLRTSDQITSVLWLIALDGIARRIVIWPPGLDTAYMPHVISTAEIDLVLPGNPSDAGSIADVARALVRESEEAKPRAANGPQTATEWILFTSGTTGVPKMVVHTLETLVGPVDRVRSLGAGAVWSTFYDVRRYGGLQILLRSLVAGGSLLLSSPSEAPADFLARVAEGGVSHISGTPSHWRRALMSAAPTRISPKYVRMSGEVADQSIIDMLRSFYPEAIVAHAFASTEAGLVFDVNDGRAGFPAGLVCEDDTAVALKVVNGSLRVRSRRTALYYLGRDMPELMDEGGYVDTGDMVELRGDRYYFAGRREGIINVGGQKAHPEEIEAVINQHQDVQMSLVKARKSPITGAIVVADVVPRSSTTSDTAERLKAEIMTLCHQNLEPYKVPVNIRIVAGLDVGVAGKLVRGRA